MMDKKFDIAGIGNACMDIVATVDDAALKNFGLEKGICTYIDLPAAQRLYKSLKNLKHVPGGCAANTAACLVSLGGSAAMLGRVAGDDLGHEIVAGMTGAGIHFLPPKDVPAEPGSTRVFCLTTPDGQRTFAAYYGAGKGLQAADLHTDILTDTHILYMDGFTFIAEGAHDAFLNAAATARKNGARLAFAPNDPVVMEKYPAMVKSFLDACDIFMGNDAEAMQLTGASDIVGVLRKLQGRGITGFVTGGAQGAWVFDALSFCHVPAIPPKIKDIDTNGAGDHFAAGFLYGLLQKWPLEKCGQLGTLCAADALTHPGARPLQPLAKYKEKMS